MAVKGVNFVIKGTNAAGPAMKQFQGQLAGVQQQYTAAKTVGSSWNKGLSENRRAVQQLGFQLTDFTVQIAGGQNAMLAFIQQGGQMLQVFGPAGAIMATFLTVFGTIALVAMKSGVALNTFIPLLGVLAVDLQWLVDILTVFGQYMIAFANLVANNLDVILIAIGILAGRWVMNMVLMSTSMIGFQAMVITMGPAMAIWTAATTVLTGALVMLRTVLMTVLPYALLLGVAWLISKFMELVDGAGGFGEAMKLVWDLAKAVFAGMGGYAYGFLMIIKSVGKSMQSAFMLAFAAILDKWNELLGKMVDGWNSMMGAIGADALMMDKPTGGLAASIRTEAGELSKQSILAAKTASEAFKTATNGIAGAWGKLKAAMEKGAGPKIDVRDMFGGLGGKKDEGGGGGGKEPKLKDIETEAERIKKIFEDLSKTISGTMLSNFKEIFKGTKSLRDGIVDMLDTVLDKMIDIIMQPVFDGFANFASKGLMGLLGFQSFAGGGSTGTAARSGGLDGKGGFMAMLHPQETVVDHTIAASRSSSGGGASGVIELVITEAPGFASKVTTIATGVAVRVTTQAARSQRDNLPNTLDALDARGTPA